MTYSEFLTLHRSYRDGSPFYRALLTRYGHTMDSERAVAIAHDHGAADALALADGDDSPWVTPTTVGTLPLVLWLGY